MTKQTTMTSQDGTKMTESSYVGGRWVLGNGPALTSDNPTSGERVLDYRSLTAEEVAEAVRVTREAAVGWGATAPLARAGIVNRMADRVEQAASELTDLVVAEVGKPLREASEEVDRAVAILRYHAQAALDPHGETIPDASGRAVLFTAREPLGTVGLITPWNFPVAIFTWKLAPALAYGNSVLIKPAPHAALTAKRMVQLWEDLLPPGVLNIAQGGAEVGALVASSRLDGISFTGSTAAGMRVAGAALESGARYQGELGGKNASIVLRSADMDASIATIVRAAFGFSGQKCTATSRVIVERAVADEFTERLQTAVEAVVVGDPASEATEFGPLIEPAAAGRVDGFVQRAVADGAKLLSGGRALPEFGPGYYAPTVVAADPHSELAQTEVFGPVLSLIVADTADEAVVIANDNDYGLAAAVFTQDLEYALRIARQLVASSIRVNGPTPGVPFNAPFGPWKMSGVGLPEQGKTAQHFFTRERTVSIGIG